MELQLKTVLLAAAFNFPIYCSIMSSSQWEVIRTVFNKCAIYKDADIAVIPSQSDASAACQMPEIHPMSSANVC